MQVGNSTFIHYPRTGGRFITQWLNTACGKQYPTSMSPSLGVAGKKWGTIRNPFDFYVSFYYLDNGRKEMFVDFLRDFLDAKVRYYWLMLKYLKIHDIGIATYCFIYFFCDYKKVFVLKEIKDLKPYIIVDKIVKYEPILVENIKKAFNLTLDERYIINKTQKIGVSTTKKPFMDYYNKELRDLIIHKDRLIFKLYPEYECNSNKS